MQYIKCIFIQLSRDELLKGTRNLGEQTGFEVISFLEEEEVDTQGSFFIPLLVSVGEKKEFFSILRKYMRSHFPGAMTEAFWATDATSEVLNNLSLQDRAAFENYNAVRREIVEVLQARPSIASFQQMADVAFQCSLDNWEIIEK
jgi:hypothetical protein